jgi:cytochrome P450
MTKPPSDGRDYFTDPSVLLDPTEYFRNALAQGPIHQLPGKDYLLITGFDECAEVARRHEDFSSIFSFSPYGAGVPLPFRPRGDDISAQIESCRRPDDLLVTYDGAFHSANRAILNRLFTPSRLKANEAFMTEHADKLIGHVVSKGGCELISDFALPFATSVIADLLGVPQHDRQLFMDAIAASPPAGTMKNDEVRTQNQIPHFEFMSGFFARYIEDRRANPKADVLHELATAKYPDGTTPELMEIVKLAMFLFVGGRGSSSKFLATCMLFIAETPGIQQQLRYNRQLIPPFIEEVLRLEGTTKATFRLARRNTRIGDVDIPAGSKLVVALAAADRDPRRWDKPDEFHVDRPRIREHLAFGRGPHTCAGAPLARTEARVVIERFLECTSEISLDEARHGRPGHRDFQFEPSYIVRGLSNLHLLLRPRSVAPGSSTALPGQA